MARKKKGVMEEIKEVEKYEFLLIEYLKEMSNELTYLLIIACSIFLFLMIDMLPAAQTGEFETLKTIFIIIILGCFGLFGFSAVTKRKIEERFKRALL